MSEFKVGDRVVAVDTEKINKECPRFYPKSGTTGVLVRGSNGLIDVQWEKGSTSGGDCWAINFCNLKPLVFEIGAKVISNKNIEGFYKSSPSYYPKVGTKGIIKSIDSLSIKVEWEEGSTNLKNCGTNTWWTPKTTIDLFIEEESKPMSTGSTKVTTVNVDMVNQPPHYTDGGIEVIDYLKAKLTTAGFQGFLQGNVLKYVSRAGKKKDCLEDLRKARWYLDKLVDSFGDPSVLDTISAKEVEAEFEIQKISKKQIGYIAGLTKKLGLDRYNLPEKISPLPNYKELTEGESTELIEKLLVMMDERGI